MKEVATMALQPGMVLGDDVYYQNQLLFAKGTELNQIIIDKLNRYSIMCVPIMEAIDMAATRYERIRYEEDFKAFEQQYAACLNRYKNAMNGFLKTGVCIENSVLLSIYHDLYAKIPFPVGMSLLDYLYNMMPNEDELTFTHCLNSALLAGTFADWASMKESDKELLILCAFYYDIGKLKLPYELLWKPGKLTDEEFRIIKTHPVIGYALLRNTPLDEHIKNTVIMHHERFDGTGYPYRMKTNKIDMFARYIAIVDTYIAMASPRTYRSAFPPLQILGTFERDFVKYDPELTMPLLKRVADAQIGSNVQLSDNSIWEVLVVRPPWYSRPILRNEKNQVLDLMDSDHLKIVKSL